MKKLIGLFLILFVLLVACDPETNVAPTIDTDNNLSWNADEDVRESMVDTDTYLFTVEIGGGVESATYQSSPAQGSMSGSLYGDYGSISGTYRGPEITGKGLTRGLVLESSHPNIVEVNTIVAFKFSDLKASILYAGDIVEISCRRDFEALSPVLNNQDWQPQARTWEFDLCRMVNPIIRRAEED